MSFPHSLTTSSLAFSTISPLFDKEAISYGCSRTNARYRWGVFILGDFRELSFYVPCGSCLTFKETFYYLFFYSISLWLSIFLSLVLFSHYFPVFLSLNFSLSFCIYICIIFLCRYLYVYLDSTNIVFDYDS